VARTPKEEAFLRLALTHTLSSAGDAMVTVAMAGSIFFTTDPNQARIKLILALVLTMAPFAVVAPFLGPAIDRSKGGRRLMLVGAAAGRALTCIYMATVLHNVLIYPCALVILILSKSHAVAKSALVPATVDGPADLVRAGGRLAVLAAVAGLAAGGPAAAVLKLASAAWVLRLGAVVYAGAAVMAIRTRPAPPAVPDPPDHVDEATRSRGVSVAAWCMTTIRACSGFLTFAVAFVLRRSHAPTWWFGVVVTAALVGAFIGNVLGPHVRRVVGEERMLTSVLLLVAAMGVLTARLDDRLGLALLAMAAGFADGMGQLAFDAIVQRDGSEGARGRSFARFEATFQLAWVGAALIPVALRIANWLACLMLAAATAAVAVAYLVARHASQQAASRQLPAPAIGGAPPAGAPAPAFAGPSDQPDPDVWSAVRGGQPWPADAGALAPPAAALAPPDAEPPPAPAVAPTDPGRGAPTDPGAGALTNSGGQVGPGQGHQPARPGGPRRNPRRADKRRP